LARARFTLPGVYPSPPFLGETSIGDFANPPQRPRMSVTNRTVVMPLLAAMAAIIVVARASPPSSTDLELHEDTCEASETNGCIQQAPQGRALLQMRKAPPSPLALVEGTITETVTAKLMEIERRVKAMQAEGQAPMGISNFINSQLLPLANATKLQLQSEVDGAKAAVDGCDTGLAAAEAGAREQETTLSIGESRHNECELEHAQKLKKAEDDCQAVNAFIAQLQAPPSVASID